MPKAESITAMSPSHSPPPLPAAKIFRVQQNHQDIYCTDLPSRTKASPPPQSCEETMSMTTASRAIAPLDNHHAQQVPMILDPESMPWSAQGPFQHDSLVQDSSAFCTPNSFIPNIDYASQTPNSLSYSINYGLTYPSHSTPSYPCIYNSNQYPALPSDTTASYPPATFFHSPPQAYDTLSLPDANTPELVQLNEDYDFHYLTHITQEGQIDYSSPYSDMSRASTPYSNEEQPVDKEQPYAQLIYRALHDAPNHTMVLRDIYDWFRKYTDKAAQSETKGWQNSIRHNLSMNGAFEKVESPSDSTTKGFMWRLTANALREGVKSTTRYRSKVPNKRTTRVQPQPQRQASGAKGGQAARRAATLRRSQRTRDSYSYPRSDPFGGSWENDSMYSSDTPRAESPYPLHGDDMMDDSLPFAPYPSTASPFGPSLALPRHMHSPSCSYGGTPLAYPLPQPPSLSPSPMIPRAADATYVPEQAPGDLFFSASPTPSGDGPVTPPQPRGLWEHGDGAVGSVVLGELGCRWEDVGGSLFV